MLRRLSVLAALLLALATFAPAEAQTGRQVWAYYFGWWTDASWSDGRLIDRPVNPYDSRDAGVIGRQIAEAQSVGIDAFIMSWFGPKNGNLTHTVFNTLLDQAAARGFRAGAAVDMQEGGYNSTIPELRETLTYLINDRANHPAYLRYAGKPVIYFWNQRRFSVAQWAALRAEVDPNRNTIWVAEGTDTSFLPVFDGLYLFNTAWASDPVAVASGWFGNVRSAGGWFYTPTVLPGWDESRMAGRPNPTDPQDRAGGGFLTRSWNGAAASGAGVILIVSWNEYFENSHIEPSQLHGRTALDTLRPLIAAWEGGGGGAMAPAAAAPSSAQPATTGPATPALSPTVSLLNVRNGPGLDNDILGMIAQGEQYPVTGDQNGWYSIDYNGATGWVFGELVTVSGGQSPAAASGSTAPAAAPSGLTYTLQFNVRLRDNPGTAAITLAGVPHTTVLPVIGRKGDGSWLQVQYNGQTGWVAAGFGSLSGSLDSVPVTYE